ncbi:Hypothetical predicted protein, partial [Mytilus galloprovincialis]
DVQCSERRISEWKSHILRTVNQDEARHDVFSKLEGKSTFDRYGLGNKISSHFFREKMSDWFGQKAYTVIVQFPFLEMKMEA